MVGITTDSNDLIYASIMIFHLDVAIVLRQHFAAHVPYVKKQEN